MSTIEQNTVEHVDMGLPASFVWDYDARRPRLTKLYEKSKVSQWNASVDVDWSVEVDPGHQPVPEGLEGVDWHSAGGPLIAELGDDPQTRHEIVAQNHGWLISQFMHGEQGALVATAKICAAATAIDDKYYAAAQVADEARHVEAYQRYLDKVGITYPASPPLKELLSQVMGHRHVDLTYLGMQVLVEGVALAAFSMGDAMFANPLIARITELVRRDEARHVAFGVLSLQGTYDEMDAADLREREDFVLEACALLRDRFQPVAVWEHFGIDTRRAAETYAQGPDMAAFRTMVFAKVVPNLRKLGLLTPRVRAGFETMGILRYERFVDSATEAGELPPDEPGAADTSDALGALRNTLAGVESIAPGPVLTVLDGLADRSRLAAVPRSRLRLRVSGCDEGDWVVVAGEGDYAYRRAGPEDDADGAVDVTIGMDLGTWTDIVAGRVTGPGALFEGRVSVAGDLTAALALEALL